MTFEKDVTGYGRKMGRNGGGNGINMEDPHPYTDAQIDQELLDDYGKTAFKYGTYTQGVGIRYRTENPSNTEAFGTGDVKPRKTGLGLPWDI